MRTFSPKRKIIELGYGKIDTNVGAFVNKVVAEALEKKKKERARWSKEAGG